MSTKPIPKLPRTEPRMFDAYTKLTRRPARSSGEIDKRHSKGRTDPSNATATREEKYRSRREIRVLS